MGPVTFRAAADSFNLDLLLPPIARPGTTEFSEEVTEFLRREFRAFGGTTSVMVNDKDILVTWNPEGTDHNPLRTILGKIHNLKAVEGIQLLEMLHNGQPNDVAVLYHLGVALSNQNEMSRAELYLQRAVGLAPTFCNAWVALGVTLMRQHKHKEAAEVLQKAVAAGPANVWALLNSGRTLLRLGSYAQAAEHLEKATSLSPGNQMAWVFYGDALRRLGKFQEAEAAYQKGIKLNPTHAMAGIARFGCSRIAQQRLQGNGRDMVQGRAVVGCMAALSILSTTTKAEHVEIMHDLTIAEIWGIDVGNHEKKYYLNNNSRPFSGLQLTCLNYVLSQVYFPGDILIVDLAEEYRMAKERISWLW